MSIPLLYNAVIEKRDQEIAALRAELAETKARLEKAARVARAAAEYREAERDVAAKIDNEGTTHSDMAAAYGLADKAQAALDAALAELEGKEENNEQSNS